MPPLPSAPGEEILAFLRKQLVCFKYACGFSSYGCKYNHGIIPAGLYQRSHIYQQTSNPTKTQPISSHNNRISKVRKTTSQTLLDQDDLQASLCAIEFLSGMSDIGYEKEAPQLFAEPEFAEEDEGQDEFGAVQMNLEEMNEDDENEEAAPPSRPYDV